MLLDVNGKKEHIEGIATVGDLLSHFGLPQVRVAVEVNEELVRRALFDDTHLQDGDRVEIVTFVGGG